MHGTMEERSNVKPYEILRYKSIDVRNDSAVFFGYTYSIYPKKAKEPLEGFAVVVDDEAKLNARRVTFSDNKGAYSKRVSVGIHKIFVTGVGYTPILISKLKFEVGDSIQINFNVPVDMMGTQN